MPITSPPPPEARIIPKDKYLAGNAMMVQVWGTQTYGIFDANNVLIFSGYTNGLEVETSKWDNLDITSIFAQYATVVGATIFSIGFADGTYKHPFTLFGGAISKLLMRQLAASATDIFAWKLKNQNTNFFLTTRTNDYTIHIPENELLPLAYYAKGLKFDIKTDDNAVVLSKDHTADINESLLIIDFSAIRSALVTSGNKLQSNFRIVTLSGWSCTVLITQATTPTHFFLKFKNSWGVYEKIAVTNVVEYLPVMQDAEKVLKFDAVVNDFVATTRRKSITNIYAAQYGYRSHDERMFLLDALQSDTVIFIAYEREYACNLSTDSSLFATTKGEPTPISLKIELQDSDTFFSPITAETDYSILATSTGDEITTDAANILV